VSRPENIDRADQIGVFLETAFHTREPGLRLPVLCRHMAAAWAGAARILWRYGDQIPATPCQFVIQLTAEFEPALIEDGFVQARLGPNVSSRRICRTCRRPGHVPYLQVLDTHHRVVLADRGRGLVQEVAAGIADAGMDALDAGFCLLPVAAELRLAAHRLLRLAQSSLMPLETVERCVERPVRERGKARHAHVDSDGIAMRNWPLDFAFGLDADKPLAARQADGDVLHRTRHVPTVAVAQPAELGQKDAAVTLIELDLFRVGVAQALALPLLLEAREVGPLGEEVGVGPFQILEPLLQGMRWCILEPRRFRTVAPLGEQLAQAGVAELLFTLLVAFLLQRECLVEHEPARPGEAAHIALLVAVRHQFVFEGLETLHGDNIVWSMSNDNDI